MLIRYGYELTFNCAEPALMVCLLDAHRDQAHNIRYETPFETTPAISTETYLDTFGNHVRRFIAPAGDLTIRRDAIVEDSGQPDPVKLDAEEIAVERLPNDTLVLRSAAVIAKPTSFVTSLGNCLGPLRAAGAGFRRSAISSATI